MIRKTLSIATLGIIDFRSKKDTLARAETERDQALAAAEKSERERERHHQRAERAERKAEKAQLEALSAEKRRRRERRRSGRSGVSSLTDVADAGVTGGRRARCKAKRAVHRARQQGEAVLTAAGQRVSTT
jgi:hypothetical protein